MGEGGRSRTRTGTRPTRYTHESSSLHATLASAATCVLVMPGSSRADVQLLNTQEHVGHHPQHVILHLLWFVVWRAWTQERMQHFETGDGMDCPRRLICTQAASRLESPTLPCDSSWSAFFSHTFKGSRLAFSTHSHNSKGYSRQSLWSE